MKSALCSPDQGGQAGEEHTGTGSDHTVQETMGQSSCLGPQERWIRVFLCGLQKAEPHHQAGRDPTTLYR